MLRQALDYLTRKVLNKQQAPRGMKKPVQLNIEQLELRWLPAQFYFGSATYSIDEPVRTVTVEIFKTSGGSGTIDYATSSGTATSGTDFTSTSGTLTFGSFPSSQYVSIPITDDDISDNGETFTISLSNPSGSHTIGSPGTATITVNDASSSWTIAGQQRVIDALQGARYPFGQASVGMQTGDFSISHSFDYGQGAAVFGQPSLVYHSDTTTVRPIVEATVTIPNGAASPESSEARFTWNGSTGSWTPFTAPATGDLRWVYGFQVSSPVGSTGLYPWTIDVVEHFSTASGLGDVARSYSGTALVVVNDGPFGNGWSIDGFHQLVAVSGGVMLVYGGGGAARLFTGTSGTLTNPANDYGTMVKNGNNTYTYTSKDQTQWNYDTSGNLTTIVDPHSLIRTFTYSASKLSTVTEPDGGVTTFTYSSNKLATIVQPGNRTITVTIDGSDDLTYIADADGTSRAFSYDGNSDLTNETWGLLTSTMTYDSSTGLLEEIDRGSGNTLEITTAVGVSLATNPGSRYGDVNTVFINSSATIATVTLDQAGRTLGYNGNLPGGGGLQGVELPGSGGISVIIVRDAAGNITSFTDAIARTTTYTYDGSGDLTQIRHPDNSLETFTYDSTFHTVLTHKNTLSKLTTFTYNGTGDLTSVKDALSNLTTYAWSSGLLQSVQDGNGKFTTFSYDANRRLESVKNGLNNLTTFTYDSSGNVHTQKDALSRVTTFLYDAKHRLLSQTDAASGVTVYTYNAQGQVTSVTDPLSRTSSFVYNSQGWNTTRTDALGTGLQRTTTYTYLATGWVSTVTDALNHTTSYTYTVYGDVKTITNPLGHRVTYTYDDARQMTAVTDGLGNTTSYTYSNRGWVTQIQNALNKFTTFTFDTEGNRQTMKDSNNGITTYTYDFVNQLTSITDPMSHTVSGVYDAVGNLIATIDALGNRTTYSFDAVNQVTSVKNALNNFVTYSYDAVGNVVTITDQLSNVTTFVYDNLNRRVNTIEPNGSKTTFIFDAASQMTGMIDPLNNRTTFVFDELGRLSREIDALNKTSTYTYNLADLLTQKKDRKSQTIDFTYDNANRLTNQVWKNSGGTTTNTVTYTYDNANRLLTASDAHGTYTFTYDAVGQVLTQRDMWNTTLTYTFDNVGNRTNVTDNFGGLETSTYDAANRLTSRKFSGISSTQLRADLAYTDRSQKATINRYSDLTASTKIGSTSFSYDAVGQLTNLQYRNGAGSILSNYTYTYDAVGRVTLENLGGTLTTFAYNSRNLLTDDSVHTYTWDDASNRTSNGATIGTGNRLASDNMFNYTYDDEGNLIQKVSVGGPTATWTYDYDVNNRLTSIVHAGGGNELYRTTYSYDVFNRRIKEVEDADGAGGGSAVETRFSYDHDKIWADLDSGNALKVRYLRDDDGSLFARVKSSGDAAWYYTDVWGSTRHMVDGSGALQDTIGYDGFGNIMSETNAAFGDRWKWQSCEDNSSTELHLLYNTYYSYYSGASINSLFQSHCLNLNYMMDDKNRSRQLEPDPIVAPGAIILEAERVTAPPPEVDTGKARTDNSKRGKFQYGDVNVGIYFPIAGPFIGLGPTGGVLFDKHGNRYVYIGVGIGTTGKNKISASGTWSPHSSITEGWNWGVAGYIGPGFQAGSTLKGNPGDDYDEVGFGTPGASATLFYVVKVGKYGDPWFPRFEGLMNNLLESLFK